MNRTHVLYSMLVTVAGLILMPAFIRIVGSYSKRFLATMATEYQSGSLSVAFVTVPNAEVGSMLARGLVEKKLVACVNIIPGIKSIYEWEGKIEEDSESLLMIKTKTDLVNDVSKFVRENHPYDVPEVISSKIDNGNPPYLKWVEETAKGK